jgi:hypothetical protein
MNTSSHPYLDAAFAHLPEETSAPLRAAHTNDPALGFALDALVAFCAGAPCPAPALGDASKWSTRQTAALTALRAFGGSSESAMNGKRTRDDEGAADGITETKRARTEQNVPADDPLCFTLPSISFTSPLRKKLTLALHKHTLRLLSPTTSAVEATIPLSSLKRAFLLPTRGKTKPHWTVVLMGSDAPPAKKAGPKKDQPVPKDEDTQVMFGTDALALAVTEYSVGASHPTVASIPKGGSTLPALTAFLSLLPQHITQHRAKQSVFRSSLAPALGTTAKTSATADAGQGEDGRAGVDAHRAARAGTLWFFAEGVLWGERPCEFFALPDLLVGQEGVRLISATGRSCAVWLRRRVPREKRDGDGQADEEEEEEGEDAVESEFGAIDGREQEPISAWIRRFGARFGVSADALAATNGDSKGKGKAAAVVPAQTGPVTMNSGEWADDDEGDDDFVGSDDGEASESGASSDGGDEKEKEGDGEEEAEASDEEDTDEDAEGEEDEDAGELDPGRHPLLKEGAMPRKLSNAVVDMVVGMVEDDMMGAEGDPERDELDE